jgi:hypothetical protein
MSSEILTPQYVPGWVDNPEEVTAVVGLQPFKCFGDTEASESNDPLPTNVYLWKLYEKITGKPWPSRNQGSVGSCVSFGTAAAIEATMAAEIAAGQAEEIANLCQEVIYGGSRIEIGRGRLGRGDGSIGAWAAQFVKDYGIIDRAKYGNYDLTTYSESRCRSWGASGVPDDLEPDVRKHPVKTITLVTTWQEAKRALANGYGIAISSNQGFQMRRDAGGFCRAAGSWAHCMALLGYTTENGREGGFICNSWGPDAHTGPVGPGNPPTCGFYAEASVVERMLKAQDSWAFSAVEGFPTKRIHWYI